MQWFKHISNSSEGKFLTELMNEFGPAGYAYYYLLLELFCEKWDGKSDPCLSFHQRIVRQKLRISLGKVQQFLNFCSTFSALSYTFVDNTFVFEIPKVLEIKSSRNVTKNNNKQLSVSIKENKNKNKNKNKNIYSAPTAKASPPAEEKQPAKKNKFTKSRHKIIRHLNQATGKHFKLNTKINTKLLDIALKEYTEGEIILAVDNMVKEWSCDPKMKKYLRPSTLFNINKIENYINNSSLDDEFKKEWKEWASKDISKPEQRVILNPMFKEIEESQNAAN